MIKLKVCGMRDPENIRDLLDKIHPDWMGLIFYPVSPRFVGTADADYIREASVRKVGVFVDDNLDNIQSRIKTFGLSTLQLHGNETADEVKMIREKTGLEIFKVISVSEKIHWPDLKPYLPYVDYFLFDTFTKGYGGSGKAFNWRLLLDYPYDKPFLLSGGINLENLEAIKELQAHVPQLMGVDINSKFEIEPGLKDVGLIEEFKGKLK